MCSAASLSYSTLILCQPCKGSFTHFHLWHLNEAEIKAKTANFNFWFGITQMSWVFLFRLLSETWQLSLSLDHCNTFFPFPPFSLSQEYLHKPGNTASLTLSSPPLLLFSLFTQLLSDYYQGLLAARDLTSEKFQGPDLGALTSGCVYYTTYKEVISGEGWCSVCMLMSSTSGETVRASQCSAHQSRQTGGNKKKLPAAWLPAFVVACQLQLTSDFWVFF